jgi:MFS family permease
VIYLPNKNFCKFLSAFAIYSSANWMSIGLIPLMISKFFGHEDEFILALFIRLLPKLLLGKFIARLLCKKNPILILISCALFLAIINITLPFLYNYLFFLVFLFLIGIIDICVIPTLLLVRSILIHENQRIIENIYYQFIARTSKILGPFFGLVVLYFYEIEVCFFLISVLFIIFCFLARFLNISLFYISKNQNYKETEEKNPTISFRFYKFTSTIFSNTSILHLLVIPAIGYQLMLGALNPFLFWSNIETFGNVDKKWMYLIVAQGIGTLIGTLIALYVQKSFFFKQKILNIYLYVSFIEGLLYLTLAWVSEFRLALIILVISGIPEIIATVIYYTIIQKSILRSDEQAFYTFSVMLLDTSYCIGVCLGEVYILGLFTLKNYWFLVTSFAILPVIPFFWILTKNQVQYKVK